MSNHITLRSHASLWPRAIIGAFILLALGDALIVKLAIDSRTGQMDERPYESGQTYQNIINEKDAAQRDGITATISLESELVRVKTLGLGRDKEWTAELRLIRPNDESLDQRLETKGAGPDFSFRSPTIKPGLWLMQLTLSDDSARYFFESRGIL